MRLKMDICCDDSAFAPRNGWEIAHILRDIAHKAEDIGQCSAADGGRIVDSNGNVVAKWSLVDADPELIALQACQAVLLWTKTPGNPGGNPRCKDFVRLAAIAIGTSATQDARLSAHSKHAKQAGIATPCSAAYQTFGGRCPNCGFHPGA
jgi:hypothetical protein